MTKKKKIQPPLKPGTSKPEIVMNFRPSRTLQASSMRFCKSGSVLKASGSVNIMKPNKSTIKKGLCNTSKNTDATKK